MKRMSMALGIFLFASLAAFAAEHKHGKTGDAGKKRADQMAISKTVKVDGYTVGFYVEPSADHLKAMEKMKKSEDAAGLKHMDEMKKFSHHVSVSVMDEKTNESVQVAEAKIKVNCPDGEPETKDLFWMAGMKHYGAAFNLADKGRCEIDVTFKAGGELKAAKMHYGEPKGPTLWLDVK